MTLDIEEVLERAFEQAFLRALEQTVQAKMEECFKNYLSEMVQSKVEECFKEIASQGAGVPEYLNVLIERWFYRRLE